MPRSGTFVHRGSVVASHLFVADNDISGIDVAAADHLERLEVSNNSNNSTPIIHLIKYFNISDRHGWKNNSNVRWL